MKANKKSTLKHYLLRGWDIQRYTNTLGRTGWSDVLAEDEFSAVSKFIDQSFKGYKFKPVQRKFKTNFYKVEIDEEDCHPIIGWSVEIVLAQDKEKAESKLNNFIIQFGYWLRWL